MIAVAFMTSEKLLRLKSQFGVVQGSLLSWQTDYLIDQTQFWVVNGQHSTVLNFTCKIPQGSVLGPTLLALYTNDLSSTVTSSGSAFMYVDDTTVYCIEDTVDNTVCIAEPCEALGRVLNEMLGMGGRETNRVNGVTETCSHLLVVGVIGTQCPCIKRKKSNRSL